MGVPLATLNRHGLIAGATGTGKTKTLQVLTEQLSAAGVPVFVADVKGDVSGLAVPGDPGGPAERRMADLGLPFAPQSFPVEFLALGGLGPGVPVRAALSDFGPGLLAKVLGANETQEASLGLVYGERTDPQSAREMLAARLEPPAPAPAEPPPDHIPVPDSMREPRRRRPQRRAPAPTKSTPEAIGDFLLSRQGGALQREVLRGVFGLLRKR